MRGRTDGVSGLEPVATINSTTAGGGGPRRSQRAFLANGSPFSDVGGPPKSGAAMEMLPQLVLYSKIRGKNKGEEHSIHHPTHLKSRASSRSPIPKQQARDAESAVQCLATELPTRYACELAARTKHADWTCGTLSTRPHLPSQQPGPCPHTFSRVARVPPSSVS